MREILGGPVALWPPGSAGPEDWREILTQKATKKESQIITSYYMCCTIWTKEIIQNNQFSWLSFNQFYNVLLSCSWVIISPSKYVLSFVWNFLGVYVSHIIQGSPSNTDFQLTRFLRTIFHSE